MSARWGRETAGRFFSRCCPLLLGLGAIAYWSLTAARHTPALRRKIEGITQCVIDVGDGRLRIAKAEGRPPGVEGSVFRYELEDGLPVLEAAPAAARLGAALRGLRIVAPPQPGRPRPARRRLAERDLAGRAGRRGLSLETLLDLAAKLNITLDELLRGEVARRATGSRAVTIRATPRATGRRRSSTTRAPAYGPTSSGSRRAAPPRPSSRTRASRSSRSRPGSCRCCSPRAARCSARARR